MDLEFFLEILGTCSTSGEERRLAEFLEERLPVPGCTVIEHEVGDGTINVMLDWSGTGKPSFVFCTHMDTVPPFIKPSVVCVRKGEILPDGRVALDDDTMITGRGSCDAKGQLFTMYNACLRLQKEGYTDFGLLLLAGEETGSHGAIAWTRDCEGGDFVLVGEPTDNCLVSASKGTKAFEITLKGRPCHSGYPEYGSSAVDKFVDFINALQRNCRPQRLDPLGEELLRMTREIQVGASRKDALRRMADRVRQPDLRSTALALIQADELGVSIGAMLRIQSEQMRSRRFDRAEKLAAEAPVKMLGPLMLCIFPAVFIILLGPVVSQALKGFL